MITRRVARMSQRIVRLGRSRKVSGTKKKNSGRKVPPTKLMMLVKAQIVTINGASSSAPEMKALRNVTKRDWVARWGELFVAFMAVKEFSDAERSRVRFYGELRFSRLELRRDA